MGDTGMNPVRQTRAARKARSNGGRLVITEVANGINGRVIQGIENRMEVL